MISYYTKALFFNYKSLPKITVTCIFIVLSNANTVQSVELAYFNSFQKISVVNHHNEISGLIDKLLKSLIFSDHESETPNTIRKTDDFLNFSKKDDELISSQEKVDMTLNFKGRGANIRILDKIYGTTSDFKIYNATIMNHDVLEIKVIECLYSDKPIVNYSGAYIKLLNTKNNELLINGWLINPHSSLFDMNSQRYDVALLSCIK